jgi:transcriptional regulator with XRE-family HTH domain
MSVLDNVKKYAKLKGYSIAQLSRDTGIAESIIFRWKTLDPSVESLNKVADYLQVSTDQLLGRPIFDNQEDQDLYDVLSEPHGVLSYEGKPVDEATKKMIIQLLRGME